MPAEVDLFFCCLVYRCIVRGVSRGRFVFLLFGLRVDCWSCQQRLICFSVVWFTGRLLGVSGEVYFFCCFVYRWIFGGVRRVRFIFLLFGLQVDCWGCHER